MKKFLLIILLLFTASFPAYTQIIEGKITYTVESARRLAFEGVPKKVEKSVFDSHMLDPDYEENKNVLNNKIQPKNRSVQLFKGFGVPAYAVTYFDNPKFTYYYIRHINQLAFTDIDEIDISKEEVKFPYRTLRYDFRGNLIAVGIYVSEDERFLYKSNGKLISHWIGDNCYNKKGKVIGTVKEVGF